MDYLSSADQTFLAPLVQQRERENRGGEGRILFSPSINQDCQQLTQNVLVIRFASNHLQAILVHICFWPSHDM